jgi:site-specific DNA recombinase
MPPSTDAASYARTSTEQQQSCGTQQALCRKLIDERHWVQRFKLQDEGEKGASPDRPAYRRLMELVEQRRVEVVVTWKLDRMFRSLKEASIAQETFQQCKVALVSVTEPFDTTTSIGRFVFGFLVNMAAFETDLIKERALLGYERRTREGKWTGPNKPYGYRCDAAGRLETDPIEATTLRLMHAQYGRMRGDGRLATWLNEQGNEWRGQPWTAERVRRALTNPIAMGDLTVRGIKAHHQGLAIVSRKRYNATAKQRLQLKHLGTHYKSMEREAGLDRVLSEYLAGLDGSDR